MKKAKTDKSKVEKENVTPVPAPAPEVKRSAKAVAKYLRIAPRKVRIVIDSIRFEPAGKALAILRNLNQKAARMAEKVLTSAVANAKVLGMAEEKLYVSDVRADGGPLFKRFLTRSMGRADRILKRTTHLSLSVSESDRTFKGYSSPDAKHEHREKPKSEKVKSGSSKKKMAGAGH